MLLKYIEMSSWGLTDIGRWYMYLWLTGLKFECFEITDLKFTHYLTLYVLLSLLSSCL